jgi:hypothetical protein
VKCSINGYEAGSEYTPENGVTVVCYAGKFKDLDDSSGAEIIHEIMEKAKNCDAFSERK